MISLSPFHAAADARLETVIGDGSAPQKNVWRRDFRFSHGQTRAGGVGGRPQARHHIRRLIVMDTDATHKTQPSPIKPVAGTPITDFGLMDQAGGAVVRGARPVVVALS